MVRCAVICMVLSVSSLSFSIAQEENPMDEELDLSEEVERLMDAQAEENGEVQLSDLTGLDEQRRLDLDRANARELENLPGITPTVARAIILMRNQMGLKSAADLLSVPGMTEGMFRSVRGFVFVSGASKERTTFRSGWDRMSGRVRLRFTQDLQTRRGFHDGSYRGSKAGILERISFSVPDRGEVNVLLEKDPGEPGLDDLLSISIRLENFLGLSNLILGDFRVEAGQGLILWGSSYRFTNGDPVLRFSKTSRGILSNRSVVEDGFLRGVGATLESGCLNLVGFFSLKHLDATVNEGEIVGFPASGHHRTTTEISRKNAAKVVIAGTRGTFQFGDRSHVGLTAYTLAFDRGISSSLPRLGGRRRINQVSFDIEQSHGVATLVGEWGLSGTGTVGGMSGLIFAVEPVAAVSMFFRASAKDMVRLQGSVPFGLFNRPEDAWSMHFGLRLRPSTAVMVSGYFDIERPRHTGVTSFPGWGRESSLQADFNPRSYVRLSLRYKEGLHQEARSAPADQGLPTRMILEQSRREFRITWKLDVGSKLAVRSRLELIRFAPGKVSSVDAGLLVFHEIKFRLTERLTTEARYMFFDTASYESRAYELENDVPGSFLNQAIFGRGSRWYLLVRIRILNDAALSAKYSETEREDVKSIGTGPDEIASNRQSRLNLQLDIAF